MVGSVNVIQSIATVFDSGRPGVPKSIIHIKNGMFNFLKDLKKKQKK